MRVNHNFWRFDEKYQSWCLDDFYAETRASRIWTVDNNITVISIALNFKSNGHSIINSSILKFEFHRIENLIIFKILTDGDFSFC